MNVGPLAIVQPNCLKFEGCILGSSANEANMQVPNKIVHESSLNNITPRTSRRSILNALMESAETRC